jgi:RNA polymerase sigma-70 factor (ECF subfamily)
VLNGEPAAVAFKDGRAIAAILVAVADGKIRHVYMQSDPERLRHVGPLN